MSESGSTRTRSPGSRRLIGSFGACVIAFAILGAVLGAGPLASAGAPRSSALPSTLAAADEVTFGAREAVPQLPCRESDDPETDLQGRIPPQDVITGRAARGYTCNVNKLAHFQSSAYSTLDSYRDCAYFGLSTTVGGVQVMDVSDPRHPVPTVKLTSRAMQDPGESLRVNAKRGLLVAAGYTNSAGSPTDTSNAPWLDIYDISKDCTQPRLLSSTDMSPALGHEGWFAPDGLTYFMSTCCAVGAPTTFPVDISNPRRPRLLDEWGFGYATHGGFTTEDNERTYVCRQQAPPNDALISLDTGSVGRAFDEEPGVLSELALEDNQFCQAVYRVTYDGKPFLIQYGERSGIPTLPDCSKADEGWSTFGYTRFIDISRARQPQVVGRALLEVDLPEHCETVVREGAALGFGYSIHHCSPDRLHDPTVLACSKFHSGMRVFDIRDPRHPVEIAYYNPGLNLVYGTASRPVVRAEQREIWFTNDATGFHVVRLPKTVWPLQGRASCPARSDYYYAQYNPRSPCSTASFAAIERAAAR